MGIRVIMQVPIGGSQKTKTKESALIMYNNEFSQNRENQIK
jgi:hypothetical protein